MQENQNINSFNNNSGVKVTAKDLVYKALLAKKGEYLTYEQIPNILINLDLIENEDDVDVLNLRNGMSKLSEEMENDDEYIIENKTLGKKKSFRILDKIQNTSYKNVEISENLKNEVVEVLDNNKYSSMEFVARRLMRDRRMPLYGTYLPLRAAGRWVRYSEKNENGLNDKKNYEGNQCEKVLKDWLTKSKKQGEVLSIIGLGVGEGIGEIELIERLLKKGFKIHYCAIDMNAYLLMDHSTRIKYKFKKEIKDKQLLCSVMSGNFLKDFSNIIKSARNEFNKTRIHDSFIPKESSILVSILGNVMGNSESKISEDMYFDIAKEEFKGQDIAFLVGVGVQQKNAKGDVIEEKYPLDDLFLTTPRYLTHELEIIKSNLPTGTQNCKEFFISENFDEDKPSVRKYEGAGFGGDYVEGSIYEFLYTTKGKLSMEIIEPDHNETLVIEANTKLLLYNIIKFDFDKLKGFLKLTGLKFPSEDIKMLNVGTQEEKRLYAVFAVTT